MHKILLFSLAIFIGHVSAEGQIRDTITAKVLEFKDLKKCLLVSVSPTNSSKDTIILISGIEPFDNTKKIKQMKLGRNYKFIIEQNIALSSPTRSSTYLPEAPDENRRVVSRNRIMSDRFNFGG